MYAHELSGGMKQRVCIAIDILLRPQLIIADEPTSALDVVTQRQVMETINRVQKSIGAAVILIGHDMGLMAQFVDKVAVMYTGRLVELSSVRDMFTKPLHPYAQALISSLPRLENKGVFQGIPGLAPSLLRLPGGCAFHPRCQHVMEVCRTVRPDLLRQDGRPQRRVPPLHRGGHLMPALMELRKVTKVYTRGLVARASTVALRDVSITLKEEEPTIMTVAGESGSGKTTLAMLLLGFIPADVRARSIYKGTGHQPARGRREGDLPPRGAGRLPGSVRRVQPVLHGGPPALRAHPTLPPGTAREARRGTGWWRRSPRSGSTRTMSWAGSLTSCPAGSGSGSTWHARWS